ncbi:MAG: ABC transporter ATP-binding protein [Rhodobacteraceae bacterium]|uniref:Carbohydrate ABC transporter ATP-binding protein, CUT1 family n=1 Tax=Salipiger profundus TaxID=1229727 RepID=A0A1U7D636_9RHOB|nr:MULTISPECIES: ABC transporter ATP-binding protein [Salipiger]MAB09042.1 ABC transporter ATP-binding protein [Paracoccaceae bacterium]HCR93587.1 ABC transporter ATP-binding protein [Oceanicaulis sp.]APX23611.1 carbohydrate ABC transporter ATP-binding protein, CUT1 family [Salipiger profundus]SFC76653.1 carbohydrate ABC transporter ATP-binding protein, CUT1 family [Salipiger profundus]GGA28115.1 glycerol-3-phosphate ABC transporter ATP-binding protein [Salipiger profundus]
MATLELTDIRKSFGSTDILKGVSLEIADGEFLSLVGPSGCGKSTLLRIIAGLESQTSGSVRIGPRLVDGIRAADRDLAMVFQSYALYPHLTVAENIAVPLTMRRLHRRDRLPVVGGWMPGARSRGAAIRTTVTEAAEALDIAHLLDRKPGQLSGGQRQRVALGRALVREPAAFLLDEPLSNLDAKMRVHMRTEIAQLNRRLGATFVYVTHDQAEAMTMSDRIAVMMEGELLQVGSPDELYDTPSDIRVARFIGSPAINLLSVETGADGVILLAGRDTGVRAGGAPIAHLGLRPEALEPCEAPGLVSGRVTVIENLGSDLFVQVQAPGISETVTLRLPSDARGKVSFGDLMHLRVRSERISAFDAMGRAAPLTMEASVYA